ncbi:MAG: 2-C-methyl-D-erythritol 4-phosphate cytidylyltransferase [Comamonadaceae bacterium]|nr:2-C-methyl-D-erythritol 4-phosphate cytidylyltransferase [Comamonadaceae bacterium]
MTAPNPPIPDPDLGSPACHAVLPCAGNGSRAGTPVPKQYQTVAGQPMVLHTLQALAAVDRIVSTLVVVQPGDAFWPPLADALPPRVGVVERGDLTRAGSVFNGLLALRERGVPDTDWVLVHDAARCLIEPAAIDRLIDACLGDAVGGLLALPLPDTLKASAAGRVSATVDRSDKWLAQTPQMFRLGPLIEALQARRAEGFAGITDEASAMEQAGHRPLLVPGPARNIKITYPEDFALAEAVLRSRT